MEWISVEDRLPANGESVLVGWEGSRDEVVAFWCGGQWSPHWDTSLCLHSRPPTHWTLLPDPPEKVEPFYINELGDGWSSVVHRGYGHIWSFHDEKSTRALCYKLNGVWGFEV